MSIPLGVEDILMSAMQVPENTLRQSYVIMIVERKRGKGKDKEEREREKERKRRGR
jgi:hypothetical protein